MPSTEASPRMKLHLGSGEHYYPGWVNVDCDPQWRTDLCCHAEALPDYYDIDTFTHVYLGHFLEHVPYDDIPAILGTVDACCTAEVRIAIVGPCYDLARIHEPGLLYNIADRGETGPGAHRWTATAELTRQALEAAGLSVQAVPVTSITRPEWPNPSTALWQCAFLCTR